MFYLMMHSTHFIDGYVASDIWQRTHPLLPLQGLLFHRQDGTYILCYTSCGALAGTRNGSVFICTTPQTGWHIHTLLHQLWSTGWNEKWLSFYMHHPTDRMAHTYFVTPVVEHWLEREMAQFLYAPPHRQDGTYILYYTSCGALAGTRNGSIFICTTPQTGWHIHTLLHQLWSTGWNEK